MPAICCRTTSRRLYSVAHHNCLPGDKAELLAEVRIRLAPPLLWMRRIWIRLNVSPHMGSWILRGSISQEKKLQLPAFPTLFIGGNHDASNYIGELFSDCKWIMEFLWSRVGVMTPIRLCTYFRTSISSDAGWCWWCLSYHC